jgi:hypothetical protein
MIERLLPDMNWHNELQEMHESPGLFHLLMHLMASGLTIGDMMAVAGGQTHTLNASRAQLRQYFVQVCGVM